MMRNGWWGGKSQSMNFSLEIPKGIECILEERRVNTRSMKAEEMPTVLDSHPDFKSLIE